MEQDQLSVKDSFLLTLSDSVATQQLGRCLAPHLQNHDVLFLVGAIGSGKTTLVAGLVAALCDQIAISPTYQLARRYQSAQLTLTHVDACRLRSSADWDALGLDDSDGALIIEWANQIELDLRPSLVFEFAVQAASFSVKVTTEQRRWRQIFEKLIIDSYRG